MSDNDQRPECPAHSDTEAGDREVPQRGDPTPAVGDPATNGTLLSRRPETDPRDTGQQLSQGEG